MRKEEGRIFVCVVGGGWMVAVRGGVGGDKHPGPAIC